MISEYEKTLNNMLKDERMKWSEDVIIKLKEKTDIDNDVFYFHCGERYREGLISKIKNYHVPLKGVSFGNQLKFYKEYIG